MAPKSELGRPWFIAADVAVGMALVAGVLLTAAYHIAARVDEVR